MKKNKNPIGTLQKNSDAVCFNVTRIPAGEVELCHSSYFSVAIPFEKSDGIKVR